MRNLLIIFIFMIFILPVNAEIGNPDSEEIENPVSEEIENPDSTEIENPVSAESEKPKSFNLYLDLEAGGGDMINAYALCGLKVLPKFYFGFGGAYTYWEEEYFGINYSQHFYTISGVLGYEMFNLSSITFDLRARIGKEFMSMKDYSASGIVLSTDLLIGYSDFYGVLAVPLFIGKEGNVMDVRVGLGYEFEIY